MSSLTVNPTSNYLREDTATSNYNGNSAIWAFDYAGYRCYGLLKCDMTSLPAGATVSAATLGLYWYGNYDGSPVGRTFNVCKVRRSDWSESQSTWNLFKTSNNWGTAGALNTSTDIDTSTAVGSVVPASFGWMTWSTLSLVNDAITNTGKILNLKLYDSVENSTDAGCKFYSIHNGSLIPYLTLTYTASGWSGTVEGTVNPAAYIGSLVANISKINGT